MQFSPFQGVVLAAVVLAAGGEFARSRVFCAMTQYVCAAVVCMAYACLRCLHKKDDRRGVRDSICERMGQTIVIVHPCDGWIIASHKL